MVRMECPRCGRTRVAQSDPSDPPGTAVVQAICNECPGPRMDELPVAYFDREGRQIGMA